MSAFLLSVVLVSVLAALGSAMLAWRLVREERSRSEARVAALGAALNGSDPGSAEPAATGTGELFAPQRPAAWRAGALIRSGVAIGLGLLLLVAAATIRSARDGPRSAAETAGATDRVPLELLSMRHEREGHVLTVHGLVRNPRKAGEVRGVTAVVFAFDRGGSYVASGRAALDFTALEPGAESPFVVTIPGVADVGRYRVSFRTNAGVVRHLDRRAAPTPLAATRLR